MCNTRVQVYYRWLVLRSSYSYNTLVLVQTPGRRRAEERRERRSREPWVGLWWVGGRWVFGASRDCRRGLGNECYPTWSREQAIRPQIVIGLLFCGQTNNGLPLSRLYKTRDEKHREYVFCALLNRSTASRNVQSMRIIRNVEAAVAEPTRTMETVLDCVSWQLTNNQTHENIWRHSLRENMFWLSLDYSLVTVYLL